ncbi:hypothetical protein [Nitrososphaera sp. AFS]|uniref:hypothetical protein n=1 Tax=Nitrososphaera sp. AFS TaxID=2301191 RepID=UPI0013922A80|nr:hypothetical protein [Nitrososphaera sp. AFS]NAL78660.1 hypothetical protein [Nitrososphaera sp. AFS]
MQNTRIAHKQISRNNSTYFTEIRFIELSAFHAAIFNKIEVENLPYGEAVYSLMDGLDTSEKLIYARK